MAGWREDGELVVYGEGFSLGRRSSGDGWWCLHNNVNLLNATELYS